MKLNPEEAQKILDSVKTLYTTDCDRFGADPGTWVNVASSMIAAVAVDPERRYLLARFRNGSVYRYREAADHLEQIRRAPSAGKHFAQHVRGRFPTELFDESAGTWKSIG